MNSVYEALKVDFGPTTRPVDRRSTTCDLFCRHGMLPGVHGPGENSRARRVAGRTRTNGSIGLALVVGQVLVAARTCESGERRSGISRRKWHLCICPAWGSVVLQRKIDQSPALAVGEECLDTPAHGELRGVSTPGERWSVDGCLAV